MIALVSLDFGGAGSMCGIGKGISLAIIAVVNGLGSNLNDKFTSVNNSLK